MMQGPGMWSLSRAAGQTGVPSQQLLLWQLDVVLASRAEMSSYTGLNFSDITAVWDCEFVCVYMPCQHLLQPERGGGPVTPFTSLAAHNAIVSIWLCSK